MANLNSTPLLSVRNLTTHFPLDEGNVVAVAGVSFDIHPGKTLGFVGESGCGKSVTARSILRILDRPGRIVDGQILLRRPVPQGLNGDDQIVDLASLDANGREMRNIRGREIALIFQEPMTSLSPVHTVGNQIIEALMTHRKIDKKQARDVTINLLRQVGIPLPEERVDSYSFELSGGLRQRAMIAMALSCSPSLLIADEPTTAVDVTTQAQILELMGQLQDQYGMAIMLITHNLGVVAEMSDDVAVMYLGQIVESGPVDDIFHSPKHPYTQALLQSIPHITSATRQRLSTITGSVPHPYARPQGCPFHPRCPSFIKGTCDTQIPRLMPIHDGQNVSCFLYHDGE